LSEAEILRDFVGMLEDHFPEAEVFRPRSIILDEFVYINDESIDKHDEWIEDETLELEEDLTKTSSQQIEVKDVPVPLSAVDASSVKLGETNRGIIS